MSKRSILDKGLLISDNPLYSPHSAYYELISRASFGIVLIIGAMLLFAIWHNILPLQQHLAMAQIIPDSAPSNTTTGAPANTTTGAPAHAAHTGIGVPNHIARPQAPEAGHPPCPDNNCHD